VDGSHPGYRNATCRRRIFFVKAQDKNDAYFVVSDIITGSGTRNVQQFLHFDPAITVTPGSEDGVILAANTPERAHLVPAAPSRDETYLDNVPLEKTPRSGLAIAIRNRRGEAREWTREEGRLCIASPDSSLKRSAKHYNLPASSVSWRYEGALPSGSHLVFQPFEEPAKLPAEWKIEALPVLDPQADGLSVTKGQTQDLFCFATTRGPRQYGDVSCDGTAAFVRLEGDQPTRVTVVNGTSLTIGHFSVTCKPAASFSLLRMGVEWLPVIDEPAPPGTIMLSVKTPLGTKGFVVGASTATDHGE